MLTVTCPSRDELLAYAAGRLPDETSGEIAAHLDSCPDCQAGLVTLEDIEDTFVAQLRQPPASDPCDPFLQESQCRVAVARARAAIGTASETPAIPSAHSLCGTILGEYELIAELGHGGMGTVFKALHTKLGRVVALKVLTTGRTHDPRAITRFEREMLAIGKLDHHHIVRAFDARDIDGTPVLVMEFIEGLDLTEIVRRLGPLPVSDACEMARQAALGLQYVHEHGLVHRDIKPSNLMLTFLPSPGTMRSNGRGEGNFLPSPAGRTRPGGRGAGGEGAEIKILDLGLARFHLEPSAPEETAATGRTVGGEITGTDQAMGTADYMAPEQVSNSRTADIRADIYSLGCTLFKLLTGRAPFDDAAHRSPAEKMAAHAAENISPICQVNPAVPASLAAVLDRMLAKSPSARFGSPAEVAEALAPFTKGADLAGLLSRAMTRNPASSESPAGDDASCRSALPAASGGRRRVILAAIVGLLMLGGLGWARGVLISVRKDGKETKVTVPAGAEVTVSEKGYVDVKLPATPSAAPPAASSPVPNSAYDVLQALGPKEQALRQYLERKDAPGALTCLDNETKPHFDRLMALLTGTELEQRTRVLVGHFSALRAAVEKRDWSAVARLYSDFPDKTYVADLQRLAMPAGPDCVEFHCRVFEAEKDLVDKLIPALQRKDGVQQTAEFFVPQRPIPNGWIGGEGESTVTAETVTITDSQMSEIGPDTLDKLLHAVAGPGLLVDRRPTASYLVWRPGSPDGWSYTRADGKWLGGGTGSSFLGFRHESGADEIHMEGALLHRFDRSPPGPANLHAKFLYEGKSPQNRALVFLVPFDRKDGSAHYLVVAYEIGKPAEDPHSAKSESSASRNISATTETWSPTIAPGGKPDLQQILTEAQDLASRGRYDEALQRHLWFHHHALEFDPAQSGVRLSFALNDWAELGRRYPKAKQALIETRDNGTREIAAGRGNFGLFLEVDAINMDIQDDEATDTLFKVIELRDKALAKQCYLLMEKRLVQRGEYEVCLAYIGDPQHRFALIRMEYESETSPILDIPKSAQDDLREMAKQTFVDRTRRLIEILVATGHKSEAEKIRDQAFAVLDDERLKSAVTDAEKKIQSKRTTPDPGAMPAAEALKHTIGIYLVTGESKDVALVDQARLADLSLAPDPLIDQNDIFSYDWESHTIRTKTQAAADRVLKRGAGAFVLVVDGQRLYSGQFVSLITSYISSAPEINVGPAAEQWQPKFAIRVYPPPRGAPDPRGDARLKKALQDMLLLPKDKPIEVKDPAATGDAGSSSTAKPREVLKTEIEAAKRLAALKEAEFNVGTTDGMELYAAKGRVEILQAELTGDPVQVAQTTLLVARRQSDLASRRYQAGTLNAADYEKAKGDVAIAEAGLRYAEAKKNDKPAAAVRLDFRVAATRRDGKSGLSDADVAEYLKDEPEKSRKAGRPYSWFELQSKKQDNLIDREYQGRSYALLSNTHDGTMFDVASWGLEKAAAKTDPQGDPIIGLEFNAKGGATMKALSKANLKRPLAIVINDVVASAPILQSTLINSAQITGHFSEDDVKQLVTQLEASIVAAKLDKGEHGRVQSGHEGFEK